MSYQQTATTSHGALWASVSILLLAGLVMTLPIITQPRHALAGHIHSIQMPHPAR